MTIKSLIFVFGMLVVFACREPTYEAASLGTLEFQVTGEEAAQPHFEKGLLLLHSFEYADARQSFQNAIKVDPDFYMAYWGEAMTHNHPLWAARYHEDGEKALKKLAKNSEKRLALAPTEMERDFMQGVEILYGEGEKVDNDKTYSKHMKYMADKYPTSSEVSAFYALSLLGSAPERDTSIYGQGAQIVKKILASNPQHPGALHYLIHAYDDPWHAHLALNAANKYSVVAPDAGHALHMPSHIYVAMGMWDEVISANTASYEASDARRVRLNLTSDARNYHALHWLMYGHLQQGSIEEARKLLADMEHYVEELSSTRARAHLTMMRSNFVVDGEAWDDSYATLEVDDSDLNIGLRSVNKFNEGFVAYHTGDQAKLEAVIAKMAEMRDAQYDKMMQSGAAMCSGVSWATQLPTEADISRAHIMEMELQAIAAHMKDAPEEAEKWMQQAVNLEEATPFIFGPPLIAKPSFELYADWLLENEQFERAAEMYEKALQKAPGRRLPSAANELCQKQLATI